MGKGREIAERNVKDHHKDKSYYVIVDGNPVPEVDLRKSREVRQEPLSRRKNRSVGIEYIRPDGYSMRHRTDSSRIKDGRTLDKGIQLYRHWFRYLKLALELESLGDNVELVTRNGSFLDYRGGGGSTGKREKIVGNRTFRCRDTVRIQVQRNKYKGWDLDRVLSEGFDDWWYGHEGWGFVWKKVGKRRSREFLSNPDVNDVQRRGHSHLFEGHYPTQITSKNEWDDNPDFLYVRIDKSSRRRDVDTFMQTIKNQMSPEGSPRYRIDEKSHPRPDVLQNRYNALVMGLKGKKPKDICTDFGQNKYIYLRATEENKTGDGERLTVPTNAKGKPLYPIVVKQQRVGGFHHLLDVMNGSFGSVPQDRGFTG